MRTMRTQNFKISRNMPFSANPAIISVVGRNLEKYQLGGVIFGCKNSTLKECQSKQIFGLPASHFSYVKNIEPGLPIFLFNYSDRKLHGIFEASSKGKMYLDPYAWIDDNSELDRTQYPAQVKIRIRLQCQPLSEDKFAGVIADNYYTNNHFWFELDHRQASKLTSLLASLAFASGCNLMWKTVSPSLPSTLKEREAFGTPIQHFSSSSKRTDSTEITSTLDGDIKPLNTQTLEKEVNENEMNLICEKLKELAHGHESQELSNSDNVNDTHDEKDMCTVENDEHVNDTLDENEMSLIDEELKELAPGHECQDLSVSDKVNDTSDGNDMCTVENDYLEMPEGLEEKEESSSPPVQHQNTIEKLMQEVEELTAFKIIQTQTNCYLEQMLREAELKIQHLMDRCTMIESAYNLPLTPVEKTVIQSYAEQHVDPEETLFLKVNFEEESWLSTIDLYCPSQYVVKSLLHMDSAHSYASMILLNVGSYIPIFYKWTLCPSLNKSKGKLAVVSLSNKIFSVDGANGIDNLLHIELLDLDIGRWMLDKIFAIAAAEIFCLSNTISGNGIDYLKFALDDMVLSVEIFYPSFVSVDGGLILKRKLCCQGGRQSPSGTPLL
ncbi:hypothetical protein VNO78_25593 [Psophocarpus tetragonolobus]|uniref:DCD domain-containing protein n=1 Tax=Psophocarpus tetragonolobus TaxID=3891 RepID=A0AAN9S776_PSOTE